SLSRRRPPPRPTLFPYTTLFRSRTAARAARHGARRGGSIARRGRRHDGFAPAPPDAARARGGGDRPRARAARGLGAFDQELRARSEEHTSELQSLAYLVCRLLLE